LPAAGEVDAPDLHIRKARNRFAVPWSCMKQSKAAKNLPIGRLVGRVEKVFQNLGAGF
jgi:hypothetical protein